ncbi:ATP-binding protein [Halarcobacter ebronensis]|uniref:ATP-binding protein n=1 Tax=Halarcobacter ebronensis TaxID=1462615 RepID=UPI003C74FCB7
MKKIFSPFFNPYIGPILVIGLTLIYLIVFILPEFSNKNKMDEMTKQSIEMVNNLKKIRSYYTSHVIKEVKNNSDIEINYEHDNKRGVIPLPATLLHDLSELVTKKDMHIKMYSNYPFPNRKDRVLSDFEKESLRYLVNNPTNIYKKAVDENGQKVFKVAIADIFYDQSCVSCHNTRADTPKNNWKLGDVRGVIQVSIPIEDNFLLTSKQIILTMSALIGIIFILGIHYSVISIERQKEHKNAKRRLEEKVEDRTQTLQNTVKLLNQYKKAVDSSAIVSKTDKRGIITYVNDEFTKVSQYKEEELIGKSHNIVRHEDMPSEIFEDLWRTITAKKIWKGQIKNKAKDGSAYHVASTIVPILNYNDEIEEFLAIRLDVTDIVHAQQKAQKADEAKSTFLANMSHEIRTPLNAIIGFSDILSNSSELKSDNKKQAQIIQTSANSLLSIINDILDISKIESGNFDIAIEKTDLYFISEHVIELFSKRASEKHLKLIFNIDHKIPLCILTDGIRLRQVLSNLLSNAIKFTQEGKVSLNITLLEEKNNRSKIRFEIEDSGIGIPQEKLENVFKPFVQVDHKSSRQYEGTGLGLSICSHIVQSLGSQIQAQSKENVGSKFFFDLEFETCDDNLHISKSFLNHIKFKVTKEDSDLYHYIKRYIGLFGTVNTDEENPDIVICSCDKTKDALDTMRERYENTPILILFDHEDEAKNFKLRANEHTLVLPFYASKVNDALQELLRKTKQVVKPSKDEIEKKYKANVLVAEDNEANQELISYILDSMNINYSIQDNGLKALREYKENSYDLILMDINMPILDGIESFKAIRKYEEEKLLKQIPVVALTANAVKGDKERFLSLGMNDYLSKPINTDELKKVFDKYLKEDILNPSSEDSSSVIANEDKLDVSKIIDKLGISENIANMIVNKFKKDITKDLEELESLIENQEKEAISQKAHYIKNSCLNVALDDICDLLQELEKVDIEKIDSNKLFNEIKSKIEDIL